MSFQALLGLLEHLSVCMKSFHKQPQGRFRLWSLKAPSMSVPKGAIRSCMVFSNLALEITCVTFAAVCLSRHSQISTQVQGAGT